MPSETCDRVRVEKYFLEEGASEERQRTGQHLESCGRCREQLDSLSRDRDAYLSVHPYTAFAARHQGKPAPASAVARPRWLPALAGGLALVALVAVFRGPGLGLQGGSAQPEDVTYKGGESLEFHYRRDGKVREGRLDEEYRAGDELQFLYASGKLSHVSLLSVDASGTVSLYRASGSGPASLPAKAGKLEPFPFGVTLDAAAGGELFVAVFSQGPVADAALESWLADAYRAVAAAQGSSAQGAGTQGGVAQTGNTQGDSPQSGGTQKGSAQPAPPATLVSLGNSLRPPAGAASGVVKTLLLRKAAP